MRLVRALSLLAACLAIALAAGGAGVAQALRGLSGPEYLQLKLAQKRIRSLESSDGRGLSQANQVCARIRGVSRLISEVRAGCLDLVRLGGDNDRLRARATQCGAHQLSEPAILGCLVPAVQAYHRDAAALYHDESAVDRLAGARGFSRACIAVIGDSPGNIAAEGRLASDLGAAVRALKSQNPQALQILSGQISSAARAVRPGPTSLSLCPHR
jgi:hypothetical protein